MDKIHYVQSYSSMQPLETPHPLLKVDVAVNPYAGCANRCAACPYGHAAKTGIKTTLLHHLDRKFSGEKRRVHVGIGTACEPYSETERRFSLTRHAVELAMRYEFPVQIFTKSTGITRDVRAFRDFSRKGLLAVSVSFFTMDSRLAKLFEPGMPLPEERLRLLRHLHRNDIFAGALLSPVIPFVNDDPDDVEELFNRVRKAGADYVVPQVLVIGNPAVRERLKTLLDKRFPDAAERFAVAYGSRRLPPEEYTERLTETFRVLSERYAMPLAVPLEQEQPAGLDLRKTLLF